MTAVACYQPGQILCEEGAPSDRLFTITRGVVSRHKALPDGRRQTTGFLFEGDLIGLASSTINACTVEAITDVEACQFKRPQFEALLEQYPDARQQVLRMTSSELLAAQEQLLVLGRKTPRERLASFLVYLVEKAERRKAPANPLALPMTRVAIADYLGLAMETVSRAMSSLVREGVIELEHANQVRILSMPSLRNIANGL